MLRRRTKEGGVGGVDGWKNYTPPSRSVQQKSVPEVKDSRLRVSLAVLKHFELTELSFQDKKSVAVAHVLATVCA